MDWLRNQLTGRREALALPLMAAMICFHIYVVAVGAPQPFTFRGTHLGLALLIVFLLFPDARTKSRFGARMDAAYGVLTAAAIGYLIVNEELLYSRFQFVNEPEIVQKWLGWGLIFLVLEGCRRTLALHCR